MVDAVFPSLVGAIHARLRAHLLTKAIVWPGPPDVGTTQGLRGQVDPEGRGRVLRLCGRATRDRRTCIASQACS